MEIEKYLLPPRRETREALKNTRCLWLTGESRVEARVRRLTGGKSRTCNDKAGFACKPRRARPVAHRGFVAPLAKDNQPWPSRRASPRHATGHAEALGIFQSYPRTSFLRFACLMLCSCMHSVFAAEPTLKPIDQLQQHLHGLDNYRADFRQVVSDEDGNALQESSGVLQVQRPQRLYWQSVEPFQSVTVSDGITIWHHDIDLSQVSRTAVEGDLSRAPALLLGGDSAALQAQFTVEMSLLKGGGQRFTLIPKNEDGAFESLSLEFSDQSVLSAMTIVDALSQITHITLSVPHGAAQFDASLFDFVVPDGVDVIESGG